MIEAAFVTITVSSLTNSCSFIDFADKTSTEVSIFS